MLMSILMLLIIVLYIYSQISQQPPKQVNNYQTQIPVNDRWYHSPLLNFSIMVPAGYTIEDKLSTVTFIKDNAKITISRNGTNYQTLEEYITHFDSQRQLTPFNVIKMKINNYDSLSRMVKFSKQNVQQKSIYIFVINQVFIFSTSSLSLFSDIDRITQSFQYIP